MVHIGFIFMLTTYYKGRDML